MTDKAKEEAISQARGELEEERDHLESLESQLEALMAELREQRAIVKKAVTKLAKLQR